MHHDICVHIILIKQRYQTTVISRNASLETKLPVKRASLSKSDICFNYIKTGDRLISCDGIIIFFVLNTFALLRNKTFDKVTSLYSIV